MKTSILIIFLAFVYINFGCSNSSAKFEESNVEKIVEKSAMARVEIIHLTNETFKQKVFNYETNEDWKYEGTTPCIIDFYADWCRPCKIIAPILEELAIEYDGKIIIYKVNTEEERELSGTFGIRSIPALLFVPVKGLPQMVQGALPKESFIQAIEEVLLKHNN